MVYQKKLNQKVLAKFALIVPILAACYLLISAFSTKTAEIVNPRLTNQCLVNQATTISNSISKEETAYLMYDGKSQQLHFTGVLANEISKELYSLTMPCEEGVKFSADFLKSTNFPKNITSARRVYYESINLTVRKKGNFLSFREYKNIRWDDIKKYSEDEDERYIEFNGTKVKNAQQQWIIIDSGSPFVKRLFPSFNLGGGGC